MLVTELILHKKMCNVRTHVAHENMMFRVRNYVTSKMCNVWTYSTHEYEVIFYPNECYENNINVSAKFYQNIPNGLRVMGIFCKRSVDKIFANCTGTDIVIIGHTLKVNL